MAFVGEHHEFREPSVALDRLKHPLGLQGECARIVVHFAMDQKHGGFDLIGMHQGRNLDIDRLGLPKWASFGLEAEGGECSVVRSAASDAGFEPLAVGQHVGGHECSIAMTTDCDPVGICDPESDGMIDSSVCGLDDLFDERIVHRFRIADNRHGRFVHNRVALQEQCQVAATGDTQERIGVPGDLACCIGIIELHGIGPQDQWQSGSGLVVGGQIQRSR